MSSLIEQAAKRLAQLRQAGVDIPEGAPAAEEASGAGGTAAPDTAGEPTIHRAAAEIQSRAAEPESPAPARAGGGRSKLVELDLEAIAATGLVTPQAPGSQIAEQYRVIKRPLLVNALGKGGVPPIENGNLIMVTSALPNEGKTFNAVNLAMSIVAELDCTVMLVDADVARPSVLQLLGLSPERGLLDLLQDDTLDFADVLLRTNVEKLSILPSGTPHPRATELLASDAMVKLINDIANKYRDRIIIFDSPPLLVTTESQALASHMGQIVVVVEAERTLQSEVMQALAAIESCPVKHVILNKAKADFKKGYSYGYGYAYRYG
ncbi:MAG TPA: XrtA-associated tyrosine autokinase [Rhodocyclaceae bacterium]|nr:XrtA-associated tyrosine autokinase [Rhodocyclaceae bacterium]